MPQNKTMRRRTLFFIVSLLVLAVFSAAGSKPFVLVIDPGHGGRDPGAIGAVAKEKNINLQVALKLGALIENKHPDVKVTYTRKTDVFVALDKRAQVANKAKADLFISIHANALKNKSFRGAETYTLGLARTDDNLAVAKRENAAILLEDDYKQKYAGFDPNSTESYIIFEFMQNKFLEQSVTFASYIQKEFSGTAKRIDRGVKQAGFLVLRETSMPGVLVELGFLTNASEEKYLNSKDGQTKLAQSIYNAFLKYKKEHDRKSGGTSVSSPADSAGSRPVSSGSTAAQVKSDKAGLVYKVQFLVSPRKLPPNSSRLKGYKNADYYIEKGMYKYTYGESANFDEIARLQRKIAKDFKDAFIVEFKNGKRIK